jgi:hypothetical protein
MRVAASTTLLIATISWAGAPVRSGLDIGQRPGPYSSLVVVGQQRGTQHCFVCESENKPIVIVFARTPSEPVGKLVHQLDSIIKKSTAELRGWATFLAPDALPIESKLIAWSQKYATGGVPITVFEDIIGPPAYRLGADADVTVSLSADRKVIATYAYRSGELNDSAIAAIVQAAGKLTSTIAPKVDKSGAK